LPGLLGMKKDAPAEQAGEHEKEKGAAHAPVFVDLPEMVANLNAPGRRPTYVKLKARVELAKAEDQAVFAAAQPRVVDLFQTYLREMRPEELRGSAGTYRLRGELITRANIAVAPARIVDVLFSELLVQ
jgi:flagellar FliL protein